MRHSKKRMGKSNIFDYILIVLQFALSVIASYFLKKVLPMKYWLIIVAIFVVLWILMFFILRKPVDEKHKYKRLWSRILSLVLSILMAAGSLVAFKGFNVLDQITGGKYQTHVISGVVLSDNVSFEKIKDLTDKTVGIVTGLDTEKVEEAKKDIADKKVNVTYQEYASLDELQQALFNKDVDMVLFSEASRGFIDEYNSEFENKTRIIYQHEVKEKIENKSSNINVTKDSFSIYISGIDTYGPVSTVSRSDVNMVMTVNPKTRTILLTSIPRDYHVTLASFGAKDKLTHAGVYGVQESVSTVENLLETDIQYYARVNFTSLITMVDAVGGVSVDNPEAFNGYHTGVHYPVGNISMDGDMALEFVRERYGLSGGDNARVANQQRVLTALLNKMMSSKIITNYSGILDSVAGSFETSLSSGDIQDLIQNQINNMSGWTIESIALSGSGSTSTSCYSMPGYALYVMEPDYSSVAVASAKIDEVLGN